MIQETGKVRKIRIPMENRKKLGDGRVIYVDVLIRERIYLLLAYSKNVRADLTPEQKKMVRKLIQLIKEE